MSVNGRGLGQKQGGFWEHGAGGVFGGERGSHSTLLMVFLCWAMYVLYQ